MGCADSSSLSSQESNGKQSYYKWCATAVDPQTREVIPGMWGECGAMPSCQPPRGEKEPLVVDGSDQTKTDYNRPKLMGEDHNLLKL